MKEEIRKQVTERVYQGFIRWLNESTIKEWESINYSDAFFDKEDMEAMVTITIKETIALMKFEQDKIAFNVVHMSGCNQQKDYCFCDLEIAKHKADTPSEKLLKILWDSGISIPESVETKEELICWLLDETKQKEAEQEKNYISIEEHNKVIDKTKECIRAEQEKEVADKFVKQSKRIQDKIKVIDKARKLGLIYITNIKGFPEVIDGEEPKDDEWHELEDWVNEQRKLVMKLSLDKHFQEDIKKQERQALLEKIDELYKKHKKCNPAGFLCLEQFVDEIKQSIGTEKEDKSLSQRYGLNSMNSAELKLSSEIPTLSARQKEVCEKCIDGLSEKIDKVVDEWYEEADLFIEPKEMNSLKQKLREAVGK